MFTRSIINSFLLFTVLGFISCNKEEPVVPVEDSVIDLPAEPFDYVNLNLPSHFVNDMPGQPLPTSINGLDNTPLDNPITNEGASLGWVLFYDKSTSNSGTCIDRSKRKPRTIKFYSYRKSCFGSLFKDIDRRKCEYRRKME